MPTIDELVQQLPNDEAEKELQKILLTQPEEKRLEVVRQLLASTETIPSGLRLASSCLQKPASMLAVLELALDRGDPSIIPGWFGPLAPRVGVRQLIQYLRQRAITDARSVARARYWLPTWLPRDDGTAAELLRTLDEELRAIIEGAESHPGSRES